jgi:multidrug efflux pump subunit AcrB
VLRPNYAVDRAQTAGITREAVAQLFSFATDGITAGAYREDDRLLPIIVRVAEGDGLSPLDQFVTSGWAHSCPSSRLSMGINVSRCRTR